MNGDSPPSAYTLCLKAQLSIALKPYLLKPFTMDKKIRETLFDPFLKNNLKAIIPELTFELSEGAIRHPALLLYQSGAFVFEVHFDQEESLPEPPKPDTGGIYSEKHQITVSGKLNGEIAFECRDIFPIFSKAYRSRGTTILRLRSNRMHLIPQGTDALTTNQLKELLGEQAEAQDTTSFRAHLIYHGPKLPMWDSQTTSTSKNDFLGVATSSSLDTHQFQGHGYQGALIQQNGEIHLHLRSTAPAPSRSKEEIIALVDQINESVGFCFGFNPWPAYREIRFDHAIIERWAMPRSDLTTTFFAPISETLWVEHLSAAESDPIRSIIPTIDEGLGALPAEQQKRVHILLWHMRSCALADLPDTTKLLIICTVLDGLTKLVANAQQDAKPATSHNWKTASSKLGLKWDWTQKVFELWGKHRHLLSHGWLWNPNEDDDTASSAAFFEDYPRLGSAFILMVARLCGYRGAILLHPLNYEVGSIDALVESDQRT